MSAVVFGVVGALGAGFASALLPLINAEAYAVIAAARLPVVPLVLALTVGQVAGKLVLFEGARRGASRYADKLASSRWASRVSGWFASGRRGGPITIAAATVGLPPLAVVSLVAGAAGQSRRLFIVLCAIGRAVRFAVLVVPVALLT